MSVLIRPITIAGVGGSGAAVAKTFSDTFNRASGTLGSDWITGLWDCQNATVANTMYSTGFAISALFDATQGLKLNQNPNGGGIQNAGQCGFMLPSSLGYLVKPTSSGLSARQFSQITFYHGALSGGAGFATGPSCLLNFGSGGSVGTCYFININSSAKTIGSITGFQNVGLGGGTFYVALNLGAVAIADGDVIRLEVTPSAGSNFIQAFQNGTSIGNTNDNNGSRPTFGTVGVFGQPFSANLGIATAEYKNFSGGLF